MVFTLFINFSFCPIKQPSCQSVKTICFILCVLAWILISFIQHLARCLIIYAQILYIFFAWQAPRNYVYELIKSNILDNSNILDRDDKMSLRCWIIIHCGIWDSWCGICNNLSNLSVLVDFSGFVYFCWLGWYYSRGCVQMLSRPINKEVFA